MRMFFVRIWRSLWDDDDRSGRTFERINSAGSNLHLGVP